MRAATFLSVLAAALSASAITVTSPSNSSSWSSTGSNTLAWSRVSTDPTNFTVVLTNTDRSVLPTNDQVLASFVDATSATSISIDAPSGGFNVGGTYRVNLVQDTNDLNTIYAQSQEFDITAGSSSATDSTASSGSTSSGSTSSTTGSATRTTATISSSNTSTGPGASGSGTATGSDLNPSSTTTNAAGSHQAEFGLLGAMLLLGGILA